MNTKAPSALALRARVLAAAEREPALPRPQEQRRRARIVALGFGASAVIVAARALLEHSRVETRAPAAPLWHVVAATNTGAPHRPLAYLSGVMLTWLVVAIAATWAGFFRGRSMLGRSKATKFCVATLTPLLLVGAWLLAAHAMLQKLDSPPPMRFDLSCALFSLACAQGPLVAFFMVRKQSDPLNSHATGAALGAVAGAWGALVYFWFCECTSALHIIAAHVLPVSALAVVGALLGEQLLGFKAPVAARVAATRNANVRNAK